MKESITAGFAPINGINMYYEIHGNGTIPLVLIHGGGSTIESTFGVLLPLFSRNNKIIAVELQAHGRTSDRNAPESFEQDADDVAALLAHLKIEKANFFGFSNGGTTTLQIALRHPQVINKMVVVSANHKREGMIAGFFEYMPHATIDDMPAALKEAYLKVTPSKEGLQAMFEKDRDRMINFTDIPDTTIRSIKKPTLLIVADHDVVTVEHVVAMSHLIEGSQLLVLPGIHGSFIGEVGTPKEGNKLPEITASLVEDFLNK